MMEMYGLIARFGGNSQAQTPAPSSSEMKGEYNFHVEIWYQINGGFWTLSTYPSLRLGSR